MLYPPGDVQGPLCLQRQYLPLADRGRCLQTDRRALAAARARGYDLTSLRSRQLEPGDFARFDLMLAMDRGHFDHLVDRGPPDVGDRIRMFLELSPDTGRVSVPDPYFGDMADYERALDLIETGTAAWFDHIRDRLD